MKEIKNKKLKKPHVNKIKYLEKKAEKMEKLVEKLEK